MDLKKAHGSVRKRAGADLEDKRLCKRLSPHVEEKVFEFRVLLPGGISLDLKIRGKSELTLEKLIEMVKQEYRRTVPESEQEKRSIDWNSRDFHIVDAYDNKIHMKLNLENFKPNKCHLLRLKDGSVEVGNYEKMWDLTPDIELLRELPEEYTFETALADLIDNSLQAVWSNKPNERKLISVKISEDKIVIFDTGPGMDGSHENSLVLWGKMGASLHRSVMRHALGGKPPYLTPCFGKFGCGGFIASMHLGRRCLVSSKTKQSKKVYMLNFDREALLRSSSKQSWRVNGGLRNPLKGEIEKASHGSFTKVEISEPVHRCMDIYRLQCTLKDIYFPYIQSNEVSNTGRTIMPIEFEVNGTNLAEIVGGKVAITNMFSCNGPEFTLKLRFSQHAISTVNPGLRLPDGNARLKCVYFPITGGKESIDTILERLEKDGCGIAEDYKNVSHVTIRRLGRLLPDARWAWLPFMEPKQRKGDRGQLLKRCCFRVICFIDTDAGFNPTTSKTDLAHHHPYTIALKNFGSKTLDKDVQISITKDGKELNITQLEKHYVDWISHMHDAYDKEVDSGGDEPIFVVGPSNKKELGISSDVIRVHKVLRRKGSSWKSGQRLKILKGAYPGFHRTTTYATLEYIILENCEGDTGGEARLICRPLGVPDQSGCTLSLNGGSSIEIQKSISLPVSVIDSGMLLAVNDADWEGQIDKYRQKAPSSIDILSSKDRHHLGFEGEFPVDIIDAGSVPPKYIVAVIRPTSFDTTAASNHLDQKDIAQENLEMTVDIIYRHENEKPKNLISRQIVPSSRKGFHGLYIFPLGRDYPELFHKAGEYTFLFSLKELDCRKFEKKLQVKALSELGRWGLFSVKKIKKLSARVGSRFPPFSIACYDKYSNRIPFPCDTKVMIKMCAGKGFSADVINIKQSMSSDNFRVKIEEVQVESCELDKIRPNYEAKFSIFPHDESVFLEIPCQVLPGVPERVLLRSPNFQKQLLPGQIISNLMLEIFDAYDNHVKEHEKIILRVDGFFLPKRDPDLEVDQIGCLNLSGLLKVKEGYGKSVSFSLLSRGRVIYEEKLQTERRELRAAFELPIISAAGSQLEDLNFEVVNSDGELDQNIHNDDNSGQPHTLTLRSDSLNIDDSLRYSFSHGCCKVRSVPLPITAGVFYFEATHSYHPELHLSIEVHVEQALEQESNLLQTPWSEGKLVSLWGSSGIESSKLEYDDVHNQTSLGRLSSQDVSVPSFEGNFWKSMIVDHMQGIEEDLHQRGLQINLLEENMEQLKVEQSSIEGDICKLEGAMDLDCCNDQERTSEKELVIEQISHIRGCAAAVICRMFQEMGNGRLMLDKDFEDNILGVVACLGVVRTNDLSRILARYLGEDQMLAIVCKSSASASNLVMHGADGQVNRANGLHARAVELGLPLNRQYIVICLENLRTYTGEICSNPQRKLAFPELTLPNGKPPPGFLGYAVNLIDTEDSLLNWRTPSGHGLRETLFYRLFGELQVYENVEYMNNAMSLITEGAVSLDGGVVTNGVSIVGSREPEIQFPKVCSVHTLEIMKQLQQMKQKLKEKSDQLKIEEKMFRRIRKKFTKKRDRYKKFLEEKGPLLQLCSGQAPQITPLVDSSSNFFSVGGLNIK